MQEDFEGRTGIAHLQHQELDFDNAIPFYDPAPPTYVPNTSTIPELVNDLFPLYQSIDMPYLDQDVWPQLGLVLPTDGPNDNIGSTPSEVQPRGRSLKNARGSLGEETASKQQKHIDEAGVSRIENHKRDFQTLEESDEDGGPDRRTKISQQNIHRKSNSLIESASCGADGLGVNPIQNELPDLTDVQNWLTERRIADAIKDDSHDTAAAIHAWLEVQENVDLTKVISPTLALD